MYLTFQSHNQKDRETQEATICVCMYVCHKKIIRLVSMNSFVYMYVDSSMISFMNPKILKIKWVFLENVKNF